MLFFEQLSKRERYIFIGTAVVLVLLILDQFVYNPLSDRLAQAQESRDKSREALRAINSELEKQTQLAPKWRQMLDSGLKSDPEEAESQVMHALHEWAQDCHVKLTKIGPDRRQETASNAPGKKRLPEISFQVTGEGNMESLARLLWRMQSATMPIRVTSVKANASKEGIDYLSFKLDLSTIYAPSPRSTAQPAPTSQPAPPAVVRTPTLAVPPLSTSPSTEPSPASQATSASQPASQASPDTGPWAAGQSSTATQPGAATQPAASGPSPAVKGSASPFGGQ
jgi:hypothetical protein